MPMAVVGTGLKDASAAAVKGSGKLRVHIQGNIHAGEVEGKESAQILLREFALGQHKDWLQSMVFLITPIFNADGNEKFALNNRQRQNGPINGMGTRPNAQGLNINRDFMKLDTPEGKAFVKLWVDYDPQVGFDLHTSDGSYSRLLPDLFAAAQPEHQRRDHEDDEGRVVPVRHEEHQGEARLGDVLLRQRRRRRAVADAAAAADAEPPSPTASAGQAACARRPPPAPPPQPTGPPRVAHVRARAALPQQLRRHAQPLRAAERGLRLRDVRGSHQGDELLHGRGAELRAPERGADQEGRGRRRPREDRRRRRWRRARGSSAAA